MAEEYVNFGNCQIVARPVQSPKVPQQDPRELSAEGVSYALPDDIHYELEAKGQENNGELTYAYD